MKIIQIAVHSGDDGELFGLDETGQLYAYRYPRAPFRSGQEKVAKDGNTGGWEHLNSEINKVITYAESKAAVSDKRISVYDLVGGEVFEVGVHGVVEFLRLHRVRAGEMAEIEVLADGMRKVFPINTLQELINMAFDKRPAGAPL